MLGWYLEGHEDLRAACDGPELDRFRILLQVSLDRIYDHCRHLSKEQLEGRTHLHCLRASEGQKTPRVRGVAPGHAEFDPRRAPNETQLEHMLRLLAGYRFAFVDLGLGNGRVLLTAAQNPSTRSLRAEFLTKFDTFE